MVGNDVVDLGDPDCLPETLNPRFDSRVFGAPERDAVDRSSHPTRERWRLWAAKEAAYKAARRLDSAVVFSPRRFEVSLDERRIAGAPLWGAVEAAGRRFTLRIDEGPAGWVHAIAWAGEEGPPHSAAIRLDARILPTCDPEAPGREVRAFVARRLSRWLGVPERELEIRKRGRIPSLFLSGSRVADLSLSHHGSCVAFACNALQLPAIRAQGRIAASIASEAPIR